MAACFRATGSNTTLNRAVSYETWRVGSRQSNHVAGRPATSVVRLQDDPHSDELCRGRVCGFLRVWAVSGIIQRRLSRQGRAEVALRAMQIEGPTARHGERSHELHATAWAQLPAGRAGMTRGPQRQHGPVLVPQSEPEIQWRDYDRIEPGIYLAHCRWAKHYRDPGFKRWTCLLRFDVLSDDLMRVLARVPFWMNLGTRDRPHETGTSKNGCGPTVSRPKGGIVCHRRCSPGGWPVSKLATQKATLRIPWFGRSSLGKPVLRGSLSQQVTQSRTARGNRNGKTELQEMNGKEVRPLPGSRVVTHSAHPRGGRAVFGSPVKGKASESRLA